eukprot:12070634-Alexandrium_andersonii.AAC.1
MKAAAEPTILSFARSRVRTKRQQRAVQRIANLAVRWAMGMDMLPDGATRSERPRPVQGVGVGRDSRHRSSS